MTHALVAACLFFIGVLLALIVTIAWVGAARGDDAVSRMWDHMADMGGMMDGNGGMHGMMGQGGGPKTTGSASGEGTVRIVDFSFQPTTLTVTPGTVVTWTNEDSAPHTATGDDFDTGMLIGGDADSLTFETPGSFAYICTYHPSMKGTVVVSP